MMSKQQLVHAGIWQHGGGSHPTVALVNSLCGALRLASVPMLLVHHGCSS